MNFRLFFCLNLFILTGCYTAYSQTRDSLQKNDTLCYKQKKNSFKPSTDFDQRFSYIRNSKVNIWGQKVGVLVNDKFKVGVGGYFLKDNLKGSKLYNSSTPDFYVKRDLMFGTFYVEPFLFRKSWWELSVPFEIGFGKTILKDYAINNDQLIASGVKYFFPTGVGLSLSLKLPPGKHFKPLRWVGVNFLTGYRYDLDEHVFNTDYDGLFWSVSGAIFLDRIVNDYKSWKHGKTQDCLPKP